MGRLFIQALEKLLAHSSSDGLDALPVAIFQSKIESLENLEAKNVLAFEKFLFELKEDIKTILKSLRSNHLSPKNKKELSL